MKAPTYKRILFWFLAIIITISFSVFQRMSGPTYSKATTVLVENQEYKIKMPRSGSTSKNCEIVLELPASMDAKLIYRPYPTNQKFDTLIFAQTPNALVAELPTQPAAGKLEYNMMISQNGEEWLVFPNENLIIRFKNEVSAGILIPHILFMFVSMLFAVNALLLAFFRMEKYKLYFILTLITLILGGFIFGPLVQKQAFDVYWSGIPFGWDLTDNKTLFGLVIMLFPLPFLKKKYFRLICAVALISMMTIFLIPHSTRGSEYNYETGVVETGEK